MMKGKIHEIPEFQVIRQDEANAKFFVASSDVITGNINSMERVETDAKAYFF